MMTIIGVLAILFVLVILFQITKAGERLAELQDEEAEQQGWNEIHARLFMIFLVGGLFASFWSIWAYRDLFIPPGLSKHAVWIDSMMNWTLACIVPVFILTHIALFWFAYKYRYNPKRKAKYFPHDNKLELIWTLIPAVVMVALVVEGMRNWFKITGPADENALVIEATGEQFKWTVRYSGEDGELGRKQIRLLSDDNPYGIDWQDKGSADDFVATTDILLPVNKEVLVKINSHDVLHSFALPHFKVKMDAVPGIPTQFKFTPLKTTEEMKKQQDDPDFVYELACMELCGPSHWNMKRIVTVVSEEEYEAWRKEQPTVMSTMTDEQKKKLLSGRTPQNKLIKGNSGH